MEIKKLEVTNENLFDILTDDSVYVIRRIYNSECRMTKISETEVKDVLSNETIVVRITNED